MDIVNGLGALADSYDAFIIDMFGVIHDGMTPFPGSVDCLAALQAAGKGVCILSNSPRLAAPCRQQAVDIGIPAELMPLIVTSGEATRAALQMHKEKYGTNCWLLGTSLADPLLDNLGYKVVTDIARADFILCSLPGTEQEDAAAIEKDLAGVAAKNIPMICANPDLVVHIGQSLHKCAGSYARLYEELGGEVVYYGKPHAPVYDLACEKLGNPDKSRILAIGDSLHTDVQGANSYGIDSLFNLVGIHWEELQCGHTPHQPDLDKLARFLDSQPHKPSAVICGFQW